MTVFYPVIAKKLKSSAR